MLSSLVRSPSRIGVKREVRRIRASPSVRFLTPFCAVTVMWVIEADVVSGGSLVMLEAADSPVLLRDPERVTELLTVKLVGVISVRATSNSGLGFD